MIDYSNAKHQASRGMNVFQLNYSPDTLYHLIGLETSNKTR